MRPDGSTRRLRCTLHALLLTAPSLSLAGGQAPAGSHGALPLSVFGTPAPINGRLAAHPKLDGSLAEIVQRLPDPHRADAWRQLRAINPAARVRWMTDRSTPEIAVDAIASGDPERLRLALERLGLRGTAVFSNDVGGWLPVDRIGEARALGELRYLRAAIVRRRSPVALQGDYVQHSALVRSQNPQLTGAGVTIGVISDSFDCYQAYANNGTPASGYNGYAYNGFTATYADDQRSGALPANVTVLKDATCANYGAPEQRPFTDEGRAITQILHVVAPGAGLAFYTGVNSEADFASGIIALQGAGAKVIDDDLGYADEPFFQDGIIAQAIDTVSSKGVAYFSSAGNDGPYAYDNNAPSFPVTATGGPNAGEQLLNFDTSGQTTTTTLPINVPALFPGEFVALVLQWDQPYVTGAPASGGARNSLDLCVSGITGSDLVINGLTAGYANVSCSGGNALGEDPLQLLYVFNPASASGSSDATPLNVSIGLKSGAPPGRIKFLLAADGAPVSINQFATNSASMQGHPMATGAVAVGAAFYFLTPACGTSPATLEPYSSAGGDPILFDQNGNRLASPQVRQKPELVGPDGANDTFLGGLLQNYKSGYSNDQVPTSTTECLNNTVVPNFFGTSAAAPHIAGIAALLWQHNPSISVATLVSALENSALAIGAAPNFQSGYGLAQADAALALIPAGTSSSSSSGGTSSSGTSSGSTTGGGSGGGGALDSAVLLTLLAAFAGRARRAGTQRRPMMPSRA